MQINWIKTGCKVEVNKRTRWKHLLWDVPEFRFIRTPSFQCKRNIDSKLIGKWDPTNEFVWNFLSENNWGLVIELRFDYLETHSNSKYLNFMTLYRIKTDLKVEIKQTNASETSCAGTTKLQWWYFLAAFGGHDFSPLRLPLLPLFPFPLPPSPRKSWDVMKIIIAELQSK